MLKFNCLLDTPRLRATLRDLVKAKGYDLLLAKEKPTVQNVYAELRKDGIEIDLVSTTYLYGEVFGSQGSNGFTVQKDLEKIRGSVFKSKIEKKKAVVRKNEIGDVSPVDAVVRHLVSLVQPDQTLPPTAQKAMQDGLMKAARRALQRRGVDLNTQGQQQEDMATILRRALDAETNQAFGVGGYLETADVMWAEFQQEMNELADAMEAKNSYGAAELRTYADMLQQAGYDLLLSTGDVKQVIAEALKENGMAKVQSIGGVSRLVTDWSAIHNAGFNFRTTLTNVMKNKGFTDAEINRVLPFFEREFNELQQAKVANKIGQLRPNTSNADIDRLAAMTSLGAFQMQEKKMLMDIFGVDGLTQDQLDSIEGLLTAYNEFMITNMADLSPTFFNTIERHIRNLVERVQEGQSTKLNVMRKIELFTQFQSAAILLNIGNALVENVSSGFAEVINTAFTNPRAFLNGAKTWLNVFSDVVQGGVRQGYEKSNVYDQAVSLEDRTSIEQAQTGKQKAAAIVTMMQRIGLTSVDAAMKGYLWKSLESYGIVAALQAQGVSKADAYTILNEAYYGNQAEIERVAKDMEDKLRAVGIGAAKGKWKRIAGELSAANMLTDGQYFKDILEMLERRGQIEQGTKDKINIDKPLMLAIREAANQSAARGLGHAGDLAITDWFDRKIIGGVNENVKKHRGNFNRQTGAEARRWLVGATFRFRSGALKWAALNFQKSSGLGLITTLLVDMAIRKKHALLRKDVLTKRLNDLSLAKSTGDQMAYASAYSEFQKDLEDAYAVRQRLARSAIQPVFAYLMFNAVLMPLLRGMFDCKTDDPKCTQKLMQKIKEKGWDNIINKMMPVAAVNYLNSLVEHKPTAQDYFNYKKAKQPADGLMHSYLSTYPWGDDMYRAASNMKESNDNQSFKNMKAFLETNVSDDPVFGPVTRIIKATPEKAEIEVGKFVGKVANLGGVFKMWDINDRYMNSIFGEGNRLKSSQYNKVKPENAWEAFLKETLLESWYYKYKGFTPKESSFK